MSGPHFEPEDNDPLFEKPHEPKDLPVGYGPPPEGFDGDPALLGPPPSTNLTDRLTVIDIVYYQLVGEGVEEDECRFERSLPCIEEQPYKRRLKATEEAAPIDPKWVENPSMVRIVNLEGKFLQRHPTPEQLEEAEGKVLELGLLELTEPLFLIPPGECQRFTPNLPVNQFTIRSQCGIARYILQVYPG